MAIKVNIEKGKTISISVMTGKLSGMHAISTYIPMNDRCMLRSTVKGSVCERCYAKAMLARRSNMRPSLEQNTVILTEKVYHVENFPILNDRYFRIEAFADLINWVQCANYFNLCKRNPECQFAMWTKNLFIVAECIRNGYEKPENLIIVFSSPMINGEVKAEKGLKAVFPFVDKVFTVFDKEFIKANGVEITCGGRKCLECLRCYTPNVGDGIEYVREQLK